MRFVTCSEQCRRNPLLLRLQPSCRAAPVTAAAVSVVALPHMLPTACDREGARVFVGAKRSSSSSSSLSCLTYGGSMSCSTCCSLGIHHFPVGVGVKIHQHGESLWSRLAELKSVSYIRDTLRLRLVYVRGASIF